MQAWSVALLAGALACGTPVVQPAPSPIPGPTPPVTENTSHTAPPGGWNVHFSPGVAAYRTTRTAAIEAPSDSGLHREISSNTTYESISLEGSMVPDTMLITVIADSFATTTQGRIGSVQPVQLPAKISARLATGSITVDGPAQTVKCDPVASALASDLRNLFPPVPLGLTPGMSWSDSIQTSGCQANIPTVIDLRRVFTVSGETRGQGQPLLIILRTDTIIARGEGSQLQHRIGLQAEGTGHATYSFDPTAGRVTRLTTDQNLILSFTTSAQTIRFRETSQQEFLLLR